MPDKKKRLDIALHEQGLVQSRERARGLIMARKVLVNERIQDKPGFLVVKEDFISLKETEIPFVSRGGIKLESALAAFGINVNERICLDVGASTGGFTDCLLKHGAKKVFAVDVGYGQLAWKLRQDQRVVAVERTNIRFMPSEMITSLMDFVTIDVSFISLKIVVPSVLKFMKKDGAIIALIKPQFEVGKGRVGKGGVVKDVCLHSEVIKSLSDFFSEAGLSIKGVIDSPILGPKGNKEFLIYMKLSDGFA
ncbi:MAG: TlyA family RNA methyltransferase [Desulfobacteraceae bacterium]|nr:MAG: TlyA family RNA methyltransferase [Desulfobacteraceae bacterium]